MMTYKKDIWTAIVLGTAWSIVLFIFAFTHLPIEKIISPLATTFKSWTQPFIAKQWKNKVGTFSMIPGWNLYNLNRVDFEGVKTLSFYDLPVADNGTLIKDVPGYEVLYSDQAQQLFQNAHDKGVKVVATLSQTDPGMIKGILDNPQAQESLMTEAIAATQEAGIDGVNIDFEFQEKTTSSYQAKFNSFVDTFTQRVHAAIPHSIVTVSVVPQAATGSLFDLKTLSQKADQIYMLAYDFPVLELKKGKLAAPEYGYKESEFWGKVNTYVGQILQDVPENKLSVETAWYGNGDNYPLYMSDETPKKKASLSTLTTPLDEKTIDKLVADVPVDAQPAARKNIPTMAKALEDEGILNYNVLAYMLATVEHETAGTFEPIEEFKGRKSARRLGYEGSTNYFGRGFVQLTHLRNYQKIGKRIGMGDQLVQNPDLALDPTVSAKILAAFFRDNGVADLASNGDFVGARTPINPDAQGEWIAGLAYKYLASTG